MDTATIELIERIGVYVQGTEESSPKPQLSEDELTALTEAGEALIKLVTDYRFRTSFPVGTRVDVLSYNGGVAYSGRVTGLSNDGNAYEIRWDDNGELMYPPKDIVRKQEGWLSPENRARIIEAHRETNQDRKSVV